MFVDCQRFAISSDMYMDYLYVQYILMWFYTTVNNDDVDG